MLIKPHNLLCLN